MIEIKANEGYVIKGINPELFDDIIIGDITVNDYILNFVKRGWKTWNGDGKIHVELKDGLYVEEFRLLIPLDGGEVLGWRPIVKVLSAIKNNEVIDGLPNIDYPEIGEYINEEGVIVPTVPSRRKTWNEYFLNYSRDGVQGNYTCVENDEYTYYNTNGCNKGVALTGTQLNIIDNLDNMTLVNSVPTIE